MNQNKSAVIRQTLRDGVEKDEIEMEKVELREEISKREQKIEDLEAENQRLRDEKGEIRKETLKGGFVAILGALAIMSSLEHFIGQPMAGIGTLAFVLILAAVSYLK